MPLSNDEMREIFQRTEIIRRPTYGIISGYHELPYVCLGAAWESDSGTMEVRGNIQVSPRFVLRPGHLESSYGEIFGEDNVDAAIAGRLFGFLGFRRHPVECSSEHLTVQNIGHAVDHVLGRVLDELERQEDITTGVILTPNTRYYPVSIERFITSILGDEFAT
jgi:hypothetical protein